MSNNFSYTVPSPNGDNEEQLFVFDSTIPYNTILWDTILNENGHTDHIIYYNLNKYQKVKSVNESTFSQIYFGYFKHGKFSHVPNPDNNDLPNWVSFNPERKAYNIRFDYVLIIEQDYSSVSVCDHYTSPITSVMSNDYQYANKPAFTHICSHPSIVEANKTLNPSVCFYINDQQSFIGCPLYSTKPIYTNSASLKSFNSDSVLNIAAEANITHSATKVTAKIYEANTDQIIHEICLDFVPENKAQIIEEFDSLFNTVILAYESTHSILPEEVNSESDIDTQIVSISKKSYISSLV
jgi:hypothetical protein